MGVEVESPGCVTRLFIHVLSLIVFGFLDLVDQLLCPVFSWLDWLLDRRQGSCYCHGEPESEFEVDGKKKSLPAPECEFWKGHSDTLYSRKRKHGRSRVHLLALHRSLSAEPTNSGSSNQLKNINDTRWSDCGCATCTAWHTHEDLFVRLGGKGATGSSSCVAGDDSEENVIFIHGFLSSSSFWTETVFPEFSESFLSTHRLFAVDLLGFGKSPKPTNCHYSNADHVEMIRKCVIDRYKLKKYHIVAHSMGCTIGLSLAGQDPSAVRSVTLLSPLYFPAMPGSQPSSHIMWMVAPRKILPVFAFGPSFMTWYEHLGRVVCIVVCKNHRLWEPVMAFILNKILRWRVPQFLVHDSMQHTHNTAWHIFHNTICSGAYTTEWSMKALEKAGKHVRVVHGDRDNICPLQCGSDLQKHYSNVSLSVIPGANHVSTVLWREKQMAQELEEEIQL